MSLRPRRRLGWGDLKMPGGLSKWGVGPGKPTVLMRFEEEPNRPGRPWQRAFAVIGIVAALLSILLIIPGLFGIRAYRRWQRGERGTPVLLIAWGVFNIPAMLYLAALVVGSMILGHPVDM